MLTFGFLSDDILNFIYFFFFFLFYFFFFFFFRKEALTIYEKSVGEKLRLSMQGAISSDIFIFFYFFFQFFFFFFQKIAFDISCKLSSNNLLFA